MGGVKELMFEREYLRGCSIEVLCAAGLTKRCPYHGEVFEHSPGLDPPYALANYKIGKDEIVLPKGVSRAEFSDILKATADEFRGICGCRACEKYWAEE